MRRRIARSLLLFPALLWALPSSAQDVGGQRAELKRRIADRRAELEALKSQKVSVLELLEISEKMALASRKRAQLLEGELRAIRLRVAIAERDEALAREEVNAVLEELSPRLRAMYRMRRRAPLDTLLSAGDFASLVWRARAMKTLVARDAELLAQARLAVTFVERSRKQAQKLRGWMATRLETLRGETGQAELRRLEFVDLLSYVKAEAVQSSRVIKELERAERQLSTLIAEMESTVSTSGFGALRGKLSLPTQGVIEVGFGKVVNPRFNTVTVQKGVDIRAPLGTPVLSVAQGKVVYAGWMRGYGNLVIVDHGDGFHTLVAHLADLQRGANEAVLPGDVLGTVGDTGSLKGAYLYFEIRQRGLAVDPAPWFDSGH